MLETKPENVQVRMLKSHTWAEEGAHRALGAWLRLSTAHKDDVGLIMGQSDLLAMGARQTLQEHNRAGGLLFAGVDGLPQGGQEFVQKGLLAATVIVPVNAGAGLEMMVKGPTKWDCAAGSYFHRSCFLSCDRITSQRSQTLNCGARVSCESWTSLEPISCDTFAAEWRKATELWEL